MASYCPEIPRYDFLSQSAVVCVAAWRVCDTQRDNSSKDTGAPKDIELFVFNNMPEQRDVKGFTSLPVNLPLDERHTVSGWSRGVAQMFSDSLSASSLVTLYYMVVLMLLKALGLAGQPDSSLLVAWHFCQGSHDVIVVDWHNYIFLGGGWDPWILSKLFILIMIVLCSETKLFLWLKLKGRKHCFKHTIYLGTWGFGLLLSRVAV